MFHQFDHRFGYYTQEMVERGQNSFKAIPNPSLEQKQDPNFVINSRYWISQNEVKKS